MLQNKVGLLMIAHGTDDTHANLGFMQALLSLDLGCPAEVAFLRHMPEFSLRHAVCRLQDQGAARIVAIPLFFATQHVHTEEIQQELHQLVGYRVRVVPGIGAHHAAVAVIAARALAYAQAPDKEALVLIGPGGGNDEAYYWHDLLRRYAKRLRCGIPYATIQWGTMLPDTVSPVMTLLGRSFDRVVTLVVASEIPLSFQEQLSQLMAGPNRIVDTRPICTDSAFAWYLRRRMSEAAAAYLRSAPELSAPLRVVH